MGRGELIAVANSDEVVRLRLSGLSGTALDGDCTARRRTLWANRSTRDGRGSHSRVEPDSPTVTSCSE
jgi:hypothetical protein